MGFELGWGAVDEVEGARQGKFFAEPCRYASAILKVLASKMGRIRLQIYQGSPLLENFRHRDCSLEDLVHDASP